jgi:hypothetical protein
MGKLLTNGEWRARSLRVWRGGPSKPTFDELVARAITHFPGWELTADDSLLTAVQFQADAHTDTVRAWCRCHLSGEAFVSAQGRERVVYCQLGSDAALVQRHWAGDLDASDPPFRPTGGITEAALD